MFLHNLEDTANLINVQLKLWRFNIGRKNHNSKNIVYVLFVDQIMKIMFMDETIESW